MTPMIVAVIVLALIFDFLNGIHDSSNVVATMISSRAIPPRTALWMTALANFVGPLVFGVAVAETIGNEIVAAEAISIQVLLARVNQRHCMEPAYMVSGLSQQFFPCSDWRFYWRSGHSGGMAGDPVAGLEKILIALFASPIIGYLIGYIALKLIMLLSWNAHPRINSWFKRAQILTALALALSHGTNDAQKTMGIITLALVTGGVLKEFAVPNWVILMCAGMIALGTALGGWKLIRTLGGKFYKIRPMDGFTSQLASAAVILGASLVGGPVSTTQVVSSSIMGVGAAERMNKVRWGVAKDIAVAWLLTIPATALFGAGMYWVITLFIP